MMRLCPEHRLEQSIVNGRVFAGTECQNYSLVSLDKHPIAVFAVTATRAALYPQQHRKLPRSYS